MSDRRTVTKTPPQPAETSAADPGGVLRPRPKTHPVQALLSPLRVVARRLTSVLALCTADNLRKAWGRIRKGELVLLANSLRNTVAQRMALREGAAPVAPEPFAPAPWIQGQPLATIVIPCFNHGAFVGQTVASALAQTFTDLEVIVVDGGSTDGTTPDIVASLAGPRTRVLIRRDGRHLAGDNRNFGIEHARGRYICCLDADDWLEPTYIEKALYFLEYRAYDVVSCSMRIFGDRVDEWRVPERPVFDDFLTGNQTPVCAVFRRALWASCGGYRDTGLGRDHVAEDWDFWFRIAANGARFRNFGPEILFNYRVLSGRASVSTLPETRSSAEQGLAIQRRNADLTTARNRKRSRHQALRSPRPDSRDVAMRLSMREASLAARRPTLLLALPHLTVGGAEKLLSQMIRGLTSAGWRTIVVATEFDPPNGGDSVTWFTAHSAECYAFPRFLPPEEWQEFLEYLLGSRKPDVLLIAGSRFVYDLLPRIAVDYPRMARLDLLFNTEGHVDRHLEYRDLLTGALCESKSVLKWLTDTANWPADAVCCVPSGIDTVTFTPGPRPEDIVRQLALAPGDLVVGWSGRLSEEKSPEVFVELAARCRDLTGVHFVMTGGGRLDGRVAGLIAALPAGTRLHRFGLVDDIRPFYRLYDVFALTSRIDGRPLAVMEAQASGCAILASRVGGVPDIMADGVTGMLANPADPADFERRLRLMLSDRPRLARMRTAAARLAVERFSVSAMVEGYHAALTQAVDRAQATGCEAVA